MKGEEHERERAVSSRLVPNSRAFSSTAEERKESGRKGRAIFYPSLPPFRLYDMTKGTGSAEGIEMMDPAPFVRSHIFPILLLKNSFGKEAVCPPGLFL